MRHLKKAELVEGVVHVRSAVRSDRHGRPHLRLAGWLHNYCVRTPGVEACDNATVRLDLDNEPQPDLSLMIRPDRGGQVKYTVDDYLEGAPELAAEITASSVSYDLHDKLNAYRRNAVREYLVWRTEDAAFDWFVLRRGRYEQLETAGGVLRSEAFPGLWLDVAALLRDDDAAVLDELGRGLATDEHRRFVERLGAAGD